VIDPIEPFDEDAYYQDPLGFFGRRRDARSAAPARLPGFGLSWVVTRYPEVRATLTDARLAKDIRRWPGGGKSRPSEVANAHAHMLNLDPPDHTRLRRLVQKAFTPGRVAQLRPRTQEIAKDLLDAMALSADGAPAEVVDLVDAYARQIPITVLCELLGVPVEDRQWIWLTMIAYDKGGEEMQRVPLKLGGYLAGLIEARRAEPGDDLLSALVLACDKAEAGQHSDTAAERHSNPPKPMDSAGQHSMTETELLSTVYQLIMAGFDTTANLIANGTLALLTHPAELARLRSDPSLLPAAIEELLRFTHPLNHATVRFTTEETPVGDVVIPAGTWVLLAISSANADPGRFPDPDRLDLGRDTSGHVAFGYGIHYCLGAPLARMEAEVAFGALLARFPGMSLAVPPQELRWRQVSLMHGLETLPVRLG
jgi:cytochrome P450